MTSLSTWLKVENKGNVAVDYADLSIRYWFTADGSAGLNYWIDFAKLATGNISGQFVNNQQRANADTYFELKAAASLGKLHPLSSTGNIQYRIAKTNWSAFDETNDHSYKVAGTFAENNKITVYYKGQLIFGEEPAMQATGRFAAPDSETASDKLNITVLGNPVFGDKADIIISGAHASPVRIMVTDLTGRILSQKLVVKPAENEHHVLQLGKNAGLYLIKVGTAKESVSVKVVKP